MRPTNIFAIGLSPLTVPCVKAGTADARGTYPSVVTTVPPAANATFDYVVIGGGLSGLTVSSLLASHPSSHSGPLRVLTIEAGNDDRTDPDVRSVFNFPANIGGPLDWQWRTEDKGGAVVLDGGKTLGGSSSINGATWTRGQEAQIDAWKELLEPDEREGWSGEEVFGFMKKVCQHFMRGFA